MENHLHRVGLQCWKVFSRLDNPSDMAGYEAAGRLLPPDLQRLRQQPVSDIETETEALYRHNITSIIQSGDWVAGACRQLTTTDAFFSAMAATQIHDTVVEAPYRTFALALPPIMLPWSFSLVSTWASRSAERGRQSAVSIYDVDGHAHVRAFGDHLHKMTWLSDQTGDSARSRDSGVRSGWYRASLCVIHINRLETRRAPESRRYREASARRASATPCDHFRQAFASRCILRPSVTMWLMAVWPPRFRP